MRVIGTSSIGSVHGRNTEHVEHCVCGQPDTLNLGLLAPSPGCVRADQTKYDVVVHECMKRNLEEKGQSFFNIPLTWTLQIAYDSTIGIILTHAREVRRQDGRHKDHTGRQVRRRTRIAVTAERTPIAFNLVAMALQPSSGKDQPRN